MDHFSDQTVERLLDDIYYAAADPRAWQVVVDRLATMCDGGVVSLQGHDHATNRHLGVLTAGFSQEAVASFREHFAGVNPWAEGMARWPVGKTLVAHNIISRDDLQKTEFYNDFLRPNGDISLGVGAIVHRSQLRFFALSVNLRAQDEERLHRKIESLFDVLGPHLQRAFRVARAVDGADLSSKGIEAYESLSTPTYLLSASGRILFANASARDPAGVATPYVDRRSLRMSFVDHRANGKLASALRGVTHRDEGFSAAETFQASHSQRGAAAIATVVPFPSPSGFHGMFETLASVERPAAILFLETPAKFRRDQSERLVCLGLSEAEAQVVLGLCEGRSVEELAASRARSVNTIRNQLQSAFSKLGVRRQAELVAKVLQLT